MKKISLKLFVILLIVISVTAGLVGMFIELGKVNTVEISKNDEDLGIKKPGTEEDSNGNKIPDYSEEFDGKIINIALFGGDRRNKNDVSHTDATIILSLDMVHKKIKLSSIMRDTYVDVYNHGKTKFTHAYVYGGPQLAIRTINENFGLDVRDYVYVDFYGLEKLIDALGGVEIDVKEEEIEQINKSVREVATIKNTEPNYVTTSGLQNLNGEQAVAYARIRYVGNGDFERTERQRKVLTYLLQKIKDAGPLKYPSIVSSLLPYVETSLSTTDILKLGTFALVSGINTIEQERFPMDKYWEGKTINKVWYLVADMDATREHIHKFIYEDTIPTENEEHQAQQSSPESESKS